MNTSKRRNARRITVRISPAVEAVLDEIATGFRGPDGNKRRWIVSRVLEEGILAMAERKREFPDKIWLTPFRLIAEETWRFPSLELCEQAEVAERAAEAAIDALLDAAAKQAAEMPDEVQDDEL